MDGREFSELRVGLELTQEEMGKRLGVGRVTVARWETGVSPVPEPAALTLRKLAARDTLEVPAGPPEEAPFEDAGDDAPKFDPVAAKLKPYPTSNTQFGASSYWDTRTPRRGWQRVPDCVRIVSDKIPNPIPYYAPDWAGVRGVPTADGRVFDFETGLEMHDYRAQGVGVERAAWSNPKREKGKR